MELWNQFVNHKGRIIHKWKHYFPAYEQHFRRYVGRPLTFLEIGCGQGGSLQMWKSYLGPHASIIGIDIEPDCLRYQEDQISIRIGSQSDVGFLQSLIDEFDGPDIVLDDGSHHMDDILTSFSFLYPLTSSTGVYMVEDLHTAYWEEYGGGFQRVGTFIEETKRHIDELNADWTRDALPPTEFTRSTQSIHIYDSIVVYERGKTLEKTAPKQGGAS